MSYSQRMIRKAVINSDKIEKADQAYENQIAT